MSDNDYLEYRFRSYITKVICHARIDYLRKLSWKDHEVSYDEASPEHFAYYDEMLPESKDEFVFENEKIDDAFQKLSVLRKRILELTFINGLKAGEIAVLLGCSINQVYKERHRAIEILRIILGGGKGDR